MKLQPAAIIGALLTTAYCLLPTPPLAAATLLYNPTTNTLTAPTPPEFFAGNAADNMFFEGATNDSFETTISITDPTADRTITLPDADLNLATDGSGAFIGANDDVTITGDYNFTELLEWDLLGNSGSNDIATEFGTRTQGLLISDHADHSSIYHLGLHSNFPTYNTGPQLSFFRERAASAAVQDGDVLGSVRAFGWDGDEFVGSLFLQMRVDGAVSDAEVPAEFAYVDKDGVDILRIRDSGRFEHDYDAAIADELVLGPQFVTLTADNQSVTAAATTSTLLLSSNSATSTSRTAVLANGTAAGQRLLIIWNDTDAGEIADSGNAALSATWTPGQYDTLHLVWTGSTWAEISRSDN